MMEPCAWMNLIDKISGHGLCSRGLHSVPNFIKANIGDLVYNGPRSKASNNSVVLFRPLGGLSLMLRVGHPMIRHPNYKFAANVPLAKSDILCISLSIIDSWLMISCARISGRTSALDEGTSLDNWPSTGTHYCHSCAYL